jgi:hypothetical protein
MYIDYRMWEVTKMDFRDIIFNGDENKLSYSVDISLLTY